VQYIGRVRTLSWDHGRAWVAARAAEWLPAIEMPDLRPLARVHTLTGLDVAADASDQLSVQMSLLVLRLRDHPTLPALAEAA